jgi:hypothetical protein
VLYTLWQVVGGVDEHLPSLPLASGVKLRSYTKLFSEVSFILKFCLSYFK